MEPVSLRADGLLLRPWSAEAPADRAALLAAFADPDHRRWNTVHAPAPDEAGVTGFLHRAAAGWREDTHAFLAVVDPADEGQVLGGVGLGRHDWTMRTTRVSYWLLRPSRGRGVATRAVRAISVWGFGELGLHRLELGHATGNLASCRVAESAGYPAEGTLRDAIVGTDGETFHDVHLHARLRTDPPPGEQGRTARAAGGRIRTEGRGPHRGGLP